jgi:hypothetical protein
LNRSQYISLGLASLVVLGVLTTMEKPAPAAKPPVEPPIPIPPIDGNFANAQILIQTLENNPAIDPAVAASQLENAASQVQVSSPQAAAELRAAAARFRAKIPGPGPGPAVDPQAERAELLRRVGILLAQATNPLTAATVNPAEMEQLAARLDAIGEGNQATALRAAATAVKLSRGGAFAAAPNGANNLRARAQMLLVRAMNPNDIDAAALDEMDRTAAELTRAGAFAEATALVTKTNELRIQKNIPRPMAVAL